jgi:hypothetical protein
LEEVVVFTTLQYPKVSEDKHALFQIKVQVKKWKVNSLFDSGSQRNLVFEKLVDEIGIETYDLVQPSSLIWLQGKIVTRITRRCKIKFAISSNYVDEVECEVEPLDTY